jgi:hypothetical protein
MEMVHDRCSTLLTGFSTALTTILPILFQYCYKCCYSDSRNLWTVKFSRNLIHSRVNPVPKLEEEWKREVWRRKIWFNPPFLWKCLYQVRVITVFPVFWLTNFVCLYTYGFWLSLWKIVLSLVILLLPLFTYIQLCLILTLTYIWKLKLDGCIFFFVVQ